MDKKEFEESFKKYSKPLIAVPFLLFGILLLNKIGLLISLWSCLTITAIFLIYKENILNTKKMILSEILFLIANIAFMILVLFLGDNFAPDLTNTLITFPF